MTKDRVVKEDERVFVVMPGGGRMIERTWGRSSTSRLDLSDVDPAIRDLVEYYNDNGIETLGSCAGHKDSGFISFGRDEDKEEIKSIARKFGISKSWFRDDGYSLYLNFPPKEVYLRSEIRKA